MALIHRNNVKLLAFILMVSIAMLSGCAHHKHHGINPRAKHLKVSSLVPPTHQPQSRVSIKGVMPYKDSIWVAGRWKHHGRGWVWVNGRWS